MPVSGTEVRVCKIVMILFSDREQFGFEAHKRISEVVGGILDDSREVGCGCAACLALPDCLKQTCGFVR